MNDALKRGFFSYFYSIILYFINYFLLLMEIGCLALCINYLIIFQLTNSSIVDYIYKILGLDSFHSTVNIDYFARCIDLQAFAVFHVLVYPKGMKDLLKLTLFPVKLEKHTKFVYWCYFSFESI